MPFADETWLWQNLDDAIVFQHKLAKKLKDFVYMSILFWIGLCLRQGIGPPSRLYWVFILFDVSNAFGTLYVPMVLMLYQSVQSEDFLWGWESSDRPKGLHPQISGKLLCTNSNKPPAQVENNLIDALSWVSKNWGIKNLRKLLSSDTFCSVGKFFKLC